jgi:hypothetical protein
VKVRPCERIGLPKALSRTADTAGYRHAKNSALSTNYSWMAAKYFLGGEMLQKRRINLSKNADFVTPMRYEKFTSAKRTFQSIEIT